MNELPFDGYPGEDDNGNDTDEADMEGDPNVYLAISVIMCIFVLIGTVGNVLLFILMQSKRMKSYSFSVYFSFAAVFNTVSVLWMCIITTYETVNDPSLEQLAAPWTFGCGVLRLLDQLPTNVSFWLMMLLSFDRLVSICFRRFAEKFCRRIVALVICISVALLIFIYSLPWNVMQGPSKSDESDEDPEEPLMCGDEPGSEVFDITTLIALLVVPVFFITVCNLLILCNLQRTKSFRLKEGDTEHGESMSNLSRLNVTIFYLLIITLVAWLPFTIVNLFELIMMEMDQEMDELAVHYAWLTTQMIAFIPLIQDFYLLMFLSPIYRREFKFLCYRLPCCIRGSEEGLGHEEATFTSVSYMKDEEGVRI